MIVHIWKLIMIYYWKQLEYLLLKYLIYNI